FEGVVVDGTLESSGAIDILDPLLLVFNTGSIYRHNNASAGDVPLATWDAGSTCEIVGLTDPVSPGNLNQTFGHFVWNTPSLLGDVNLGGQLSSISGNLRLVSTGSRRVFFASGGSGYTLSIEGDLIVE